jgi:hypothetical protein
MDRLSARIRSTYPHSSLQLAASENVFSSNIVWNQWMIRILKYQSLTKQILLNIQSNPAPFEIQIERWSINIVEHNEHMNTKTIEPVGAKNDTTANTCILFKLMHKVGYTLFNFQIDSFRKTYLGLVWIWLIFELMKTTFANKQTFKLFHKFSLTKIVSF